MAALFKTRIIIHSPQKTRPWERKSFSRGLFFHNFSVCKLGFWAPAKVSRNDSCKGPSLLPRLAGLEGKRTENPAFHSPKKTKDFCLRNIEWFGWMPRLTHWPPVSKEKKKYILMRRFNQSILFFSLLKDKSSRSFARSGNGMVLKKKANKYQRRRLVATEKRDKYHQLGEFVVKVRGMFSSYPSIEGLRIKGRDQKVSE